LEVLPQVSQMICGGGPRRSTRSTKSLSLVMTMAFCAFAASNISGSSASLRPRSRRAMASRPRVFVIQTAIAGDSWASTQMVILPAPDG
jgi:hypothetical protein